MILLSETFCGEVMCNILDRQILGEISLDFNTGRWQSCAERGDDTARRGTKKARPRGAGRAGGGLGAKFT